MGVHEVLTLSLARASTLSSHDRRRLEESTLRRRFARSRAKLAVDDRSACNDEAATAPTAITTATATPELPSVDGYRRLITELFGHAGVVPPRAIASRDLNGLARVGRRPLRLVGA